MLQLSPDGRVLIRGIEKLVPTFYYDSKGVSTVGYGHAIVMNGAQVNKNSLGQAKADALSQQYMMQKWGKLTITDAEADALFTEDMKRFEDAVNTVVDATTYQAEFDAMSSFAFNCGPDAFKSGTLARLHKAGQRKVGDVSMSTLCAWSKDPVASKTPGNIQQAFVAWSRSGGVWLLGLFRRRVSELLVYGGHSVEEAVKTAWSFHD